LQRGHFFRHLIEGIADPERLRVLELAVLPSVIEA